MNWKDLAKDAIEAAHDVFVEPVDYAGSTAMKQASFADANITRQLERAEELAESQQIFGLANVSNLLDQDYSNSGRVVRAHGEEMTPEDRSRLEFERGMVGIEAAKKVALDKQELEKKKMEGQVDINLRLSAKRKLHGLNRRLRQDNAGDET